MDAFFFKYRGSTASLPLSLEMVKRIKEFHMGMAGIITMVIQLIA